MIQNDMETFTMAQSTAPLSVLPRPLLHSLIELAQRAFETGHTRIGEQLLDLVNESYLRS